MVTFNAMHVLLYVLAGIGALWLIPRIIGAVLYLATGIWFMIKGDG